MSTSGTTAAQHNARRRLGTWLRVLTGVLLSLLLAAAVWCRWVYVQIETYADLDQADKADAIAVFGAAEYGGKPSPVFRARLDHAKSLYARGIAPLIITLGGPGGDGFSEGAVGQDYLMGAGLPESGTIAETQSRNTSASVRRLAVIAHANRLNRIVIVSDRLHMFRLHEICEAAGLNVLSSPRAPVPTEQKPQSTDTVFHELVTYTLWRLHLD